MHPRSHHWHFTDYVIVRRRDWHNVRVIETLRSAECWNNHLIISKDILISNIKHLNITHLQQEHTRLAFVEALDRHLDSLSFGHTDTEEDWNAFKTMLHFCLQPLNHMVFLQVLHQDCFHENASPT